MHHLAVFDKFLQRVFRGEIGHQNGYSRNTTG